MHIQKHMHITKLPDFPEPAIRHKISRCNEREIFLYAKIRVIQNVL